MPIKIGDIVYRGENVSASKSGEPIFDENGFGLMPVQVWGNPPRTEYKGIAPKGLNGYFVEVCKCHPEKTDFTFVSIEGGQYFS